MSKVTMPEPVILRTVIPDDHRYGHVYGFTRRQMEAYAAAKVREALESLQWISVADRLPDERERVLAFGRIRSTNVGPGKLGISVAWRIDDRYFTDGASNVLGAMLCVTHWMPLPAPPLPGPGEP